MKRYTKEELFRMDAVDVYKLVLEKKYIKIFPRGFWQQPEALDNASKCIRYLIEDVLYLSDNDLKARLCRKMFDDNKLRGMLNTCFNGSPLKAIQLAYPNKFKPWEFNIVNNGYWQDINNIIESIHWLIEDKLKLTDDELKEKLSRNIFSDNGLDGMLSSCFNSSPVKAIQLAYPNKFKPWEFNCVAKNYWNDTSNGIKATRWLIEEKLKLTDEELKEQLSLKLFADNGLIGMLSSCFNNSPFKAIEMTYPGKFKKEDFKNYNRMKKL